MCSVSDTSSPGRNCPGQFLVVKLGVTVWRREFSCLTHMAHVISAVSNLSLLILRCSLAALPIHNELDLFYPLSEFCREIPSSLFFQ